MDVEALSVTPYSRRALDREFAATFIAAVRNLDERYSRNRDAHDLPLDGEIVTRVRRRLRQRASKRQRVGVRRRRLPGREGQGAAG